MVPKIFWKSMKLWVVEVFIFGTIICIYNQYVESLRLKEPQLPHSYRWRAIAIGMAAVGVVTYGLLYSFGFIHTRPVQDKTIQICKPLLSSAFFFTCTSRVYNNLHVHVAASAGLGHDSSNAWNCRIFILTTLQYNYYIFVPASDTAASYIVYNCTSGGYFAIVTLRTAMIPIGAVWWRLHLGERAGTLLGNTSRATLLKTSWTMFVPARGWNTPPHKR